MKKYEDIISLPHHVSDHHPQMSIHDRAAQFSPFAALTGYGDAVEETARLTSQKKILDETEREALDRRDFWRRAGRQTEDVGAFPGSGSHIFFRTRKRAGELI